MNNKPIAVPKKDKISKKNFYPYIADVFKNNNQGVTYADIVKEMVFSQANAAVNRVVMQANSPIYLPHFRTLFHPFNTDYLFLFNTDDAVSSRLSYFLNIHADNFSYKGNGGIKNAIREKVLETYNDLFRKYNGKKYDPRDCNNKEKIAKVVIDDLHSDENEKRVENFLKSVVRPSILSAKKKFLADSLDAVLNKQNIQNDSDRDDFMKLFTNLDGKDGFSFEGESSYRAADDNVSITNIINWHNFFDAQLAKIPETSIYK